MRGAVGDGLSDHTTCTTCGTIHDSGLEETVTACPDCNGEPMTLTAWLKAQGLPNLPASKLLKSPDSLRPAQRAYLVAYLKRLAEGDFRA